MANQKVRWSPDWCTCQVTYQYDDSLPIDNIVFTGSEIHQKCPVHSNITDPVQLYNVLHEETILKERSRQAIADALPDQLVTIDPQTQSRSQDQSKVDITFDFTGANPIRRNVNANFKILDSRIRFQSSDRTTFATTLRSKIASDPIMDTTRRSRVSIFDADDSTRTPLNS